MTAGRVASGLTLALLLVGAAVHYRSARRASGALVSAAAESDSLEACPAAAMVYPASDPTATPVAATDANGEDAILVATKTCGCGSAVCTAGRVCVKGAVGKNEDKCYLPRCKNDKATKIPGAIYTAGCLCGGNDLFASSDPKYIINTVAPAGGTLDNTIIADCHATAKSEVDKCLCGTVSVCTKGQVCTDTTTGACDGDVPTDQAVADYKVLGLYIHAMPANLTDASKFAVCKNTNSAGDQACDIDGVEKCVKV